MGSRNFFKVPHMLHNQRHGDGSSAPALLLSNHPSESLDEGHSLPQQWELYNPFSHTFHSRQWEADTIAREQHKKSLLALPQLENDHISMHKKATFSLLGGYRAAFMSRMAGCNKGTCVVYAEYKTIACPDKALIGTHFEQLLSLFHGLTNPTLHCGRTPIPDCDHHKHRNKFLIET